MKLKQKLIIEQKTIEFCKEVDHLILTEENKRIYNVLLSIEEQNLINLR